MAKKFPTTVQEVFQLSSDDAEEFLYKLEAALVDLIPPEPPEDFDTKEAMWVLAYTVDMLNRLSTHPDNPFGAEGWLAHLPEDSELDS
jgi:hypothetical protein